MKKTNPLVGILATALVVTISIIIMMGIYIGKLNKDIKILKGEDVSAQSNPEGQAEEEAKEIKFTQFDSSFYKIEDCAVEKVECATIADKIDYEFDIDADSSMDKITVEVDKKGKKAIIFKINGSEFDNGSDMKGAKFFLADLNKFDNTIEVVIYDEGENGKPHYLVYSKSGSRMKLLEDIDGSELYLDEIGKIAALSNKAPKTNPIVFSEYYEFEEGKLSTEALNATRVKNIEFTAENEYFTTDLNNLDDYYDLVGIKKSGKKKNTNTNINNNNNTTEKNNNTNNSTNTNSSTEYEAGDLTGVNEEFLEKAKIEKLTSEDKFEIKSFTEDLDIEVELKDGRKGYVLSDLLSESGK